MQLLQILRAIKPRVNIWMESLSSKYDPTHFKNEREKLWLRQQSSHYIGEVVKVGYGLSVSKWSKGRCLNST